MSSIIFSSVLHSLISDDKIAEYYKRYSTKPVMDPPTWRLVKASLVAIIDDCTAGQHRNGTAKAFGQQAINLALILLHLQGRSYPEGLAIENDGRNIP